MKGEKQAPLRFFLRGYSCPILPAINWIEVGDGTFLNNPIPMAKTSF
jgi:hypothetical protein